MDHLGLVAGMCSELSISEQIDAILPEARSSKILSHGECIVGMILNGLGFFNKRLYLTPRFFEGKPLERLFRDGIQASHFNDDALGRSLDALYDYGVSELFMKIGLKSLKYLGIDVQGYNIDSSSFHVDGVYNSQDIPEAGEIHICKGYSRDHHPELNQVVVNFIVENQAGIPIFMEACSGNCSDSKSFRRIVEGYLDSLQKSHRADYFIGDAALYNAQTLAVFEAKAEKFISRVPLSIKEAKDLLEQLNQQSFQVIDDNYSYCEFSSNYGDVNQRWILIKSSHRKSSSLKTLYKDLASNTLKEYQRFEKLKRQSFSCQEDAHQAYLNLEKTLKICRIDNFEMICKAHYPRKGRPAKGQPPDCQTYHIQGALGSDLDKYSKLQSQKGYFILATNELDTEKLPAKKVLSEYKSQSRIEGGFRFLKDPLFFASAIFLKSPKRIEALLMVMGLALMVYAALEYRIRKGLKITQQTYPNQVGKQISNPTARWIFQDFEDINILIISQIQSLVLNLKQRHRIIIDILGKMYWKYYT